MRVLRRSRPTIEVPLGTIRPPSGGLNLYSSFAIEALLSYASPALDLVSSEMSLAVNGVPFDVPSDVPGRLSMIYSPGKRIILKFSNRSIPGSGSSIPSPPPTKLLLDASSSALSIDLNGLLILLPSFSGRSEAFSSLALT